MKNISVNHIVRHASPPAVGLLALAALAFTSLSQAQSPVADQSASAAPATAPASPAKSSTAQTKPKKAAKKKEEPEEEWILLPEPVKGPAVPHHRVQPPLTQPRQPRLDLRPP